MAESNNFDFGSIANMLNNIDIGQLSSMLGSFNSGPSKSHGDVRNEGRAIELLNALKPMLSNERSDIIDMVLQIYVISKIMKH